MKKTIATFAFFLGMAASIFGQETTVTWEPSVEQKNDSVYDLVLKATLKEGWHLYAQHLPKGGPLATEFTFENPENLFQLIGATKEGEAIQSYEEIFDTETAYFEKEAVFTQRILLKSNKKSPIKCLVAYQTCNDQSCTFEPGEEIWFVFESDSLALRPKTVDAASQIQSDALNLHLKKTAHFLAANPLSKKEDKGLTTLFLLGFFGGLIALLTPCVFPMIPLTVSFFTKRHEEKKKGISNALLYGLFITLIYLLLSLPFHFLDSVDPEILNSISTHTGLNVFFFVVFVFFALSFFGYFELTLPHSWSDKMDNASDVGGVIGTFFMALTLAIVSFSCTGPILGSLLVGALSSDGGALQLSVGMVGFGTALALPFSLFAMFPNWLNTLPKSGSWLNTVKVVLGFLEIALAFKFLSNADMVDHWGLLKREVFIGIWILVFAGLTLYLFGKISFPHDAPMQKLSKTRGGLGVVAFLFVGYLISGLFFETTLNGLSGFAPPKFYSLQQKKNDCPLELNCFKDFETGRIHAEKTNKPILLDFTGWACVNCRKMEQNVWSDPAVYKALEKFVLISLYVDDRQKLPVHEQFDYQKRDGKIKRIRTVGSKWSTFQTINFQTASQPFYVQLTPEMELLNRPEKYTDKTSYLKWLREGLDRFEK